MKRSTLFGLVFLLGMGLLMSGCSLRNRNYHGQVAPQPTTVTSQPQSLGGSTGETQFQATPAGSSGTIGQAATQAAQQIDNLQSTLQAQDLSTPSSLTTAQDDTEQSLDSLLQSIQAEPTP